jgi:hypothetical protein
MVEAVSSEAGELFGSFVGPSNSKLIVEGSAAHFADKPRIVDEIKRELDDDVGGVSGSERFFCFLPRF